MLYLWLFILILFNGLWLVLVLFGLPGNWLMVLTTSLFAWWRWDERVFSGWTLMAIAVLALLGELIEFFAGMVGARRSGASWAASITGLFGALVGAAAGTFVSPVPFLGTVVGACLGAGLSVWAMEVSRGEHPDRSLQRGVGAGVGKFFGILGKFVLGIVILLVIIVAAFWP
jgi:uncharacterized protein YqgC (DUF456 family)